MKGIGQQSVGNRGHTGLASIISTNGTKRGDNIRARHQTRRSENGARGSD